MVQGVFRGLGDTRTPLYATLACNLLNIILNPLLIFGFKLGVAGSALGTLIAQVTRHSTEGITSSKQHEMQQSLSNAPHAGHSSHARCIPAPALQGFAMQA